MPASIDLPNIMVAGAADQAGDVISFTSVGKSVDVYSNGFEVIVTELCETELKRPRKTEPLKGVIDKLNSEDKVF
jgi:hypothetical protein